MQNTTHSDQSKKQQTGTFAKNAVFPSLAELFTKVQDELAC